MFYKHYNLRKSNFFDAFINDHSKIINAQIQHEQLTTFPPFKLFIAIVINFLTFLSSNTFL